MPWVFQEVEDPRFPENRHMKVVRWPPLRCKRYLWLISLRSWVDPGGIVRPEGLNQWKIPMTPSGIEPANFWLVTQCFNELYHRELLIII
jgi:hypothetical protein